jgi:organic hydroperoxide reductase OsmC/OhrA
LSRHTATIYWQRGEQVFTDNKYSREHSWNFDGGCEVTASASPEEVALPYSNPNAVDPEEAFVASISSCHMLWFLSLAAKQGFVVEEYRDNAEGILEKNLENKRAITRVILRPDVVFPKNNAPDQQKFDKLHQQAHNKCFIAHSVKTRITIEASFNIT